MWMCVYICLCMHIHVQVHMHKCTSVGWLIRSPGICPSQPLWFWDSRLMPTQLALSHGFWGLSWSLMVVRRALPIESLFQPNCSHSIQDPFHVIIVYKADYIPIDQKTSFANRIVSGLWGHSCCAQNLRSFKGKKRLLYFLLTSSLFGFWLDFFFF